MLGLIILSLEICVQSNSCHILIFLNVPFTSNKNNLQGFLYFSHDHNKTSNTDSMVTTSKPCFLVDPRQASSQAAVSSNTKRIHVPFMYLQWTDTVAPQFSHVTSSLRQLQLFHGRIYCALRDEVDWLLRLHRQGSLTEFNHRQKKSASSS